ncbi:hypothetical protein BD413DRAFT_198810 [Trametes elegans]|nr:hypothetical protein BD413DRAFT_198810 [Trametes elegans]
MDSAAQNRIDEERKQGEIRRQIAHLQAQLNPSSVLTAPATPASPKRKRSGSHLLIPATPSPKKKKAIDKEPRRIQGNAPQRGASSAGLSSGYRSSTGVAAPSFPLKPQKSVGPPAPSTVLHKLAQAHQSKDKTSALETSARSNAFSDRPPINASPTTDSMAATIRDDSLVLIEELPLGAQEHNAPFDDPHFEKLEPNSGIRLSSRAIPYSDFQDHLRGRYYISPSKLYAVIRLLPSKQGYDVPVSGDWLTIAVVAERGKMKYTRAPVGVGHDDKSLQDTDEVRMDALPSLDGAPQAGPSRPPPFRRKAKEEPPKPSGKKYVNLKLIDFGCRSQGSSADGGKAKIRGDAFLTLLLFESDSCDVVTKENGKKEKVYRGGSRGAFERMSKLREGAVVAMLNPKILKPFQRSGDAPHPTDNILALTPESDASIAVIGYAQDLGTCKAMKRDGTRCTGWCDKRVSDVCDYHIQHAVERKRAARPEFSIGTGGMSSFAKKKTTYDPSRQWGLKPEVEPSGATYVVQGHVVSGSDSRSLHLSETIGRDAQAKAARKLSAVDSEKALQQLLKRDKAGTKALMTAREFLKRKAEGANGATTKGVAPEKKPLDNDEDRKPRKNAYSAQLIKQLGFDPTAKDGRQAKDANVQSKLDALAAVQAKRTIELGPRPGKRNTCVRQPQPSSASPSMSSAPAPATHDDLEYADEDDGADSPLQIPDSDDDGDSEGPATSDRSMGRTSGDGLVDLDGSDE